MFDKSIPGMERAVRAARPNVLTDRIVSALRIVRHGAPCSTSGCRGAAHAVDGGGRPWCPSCFATRRRIALELR